MPAERNSHRCEPVAPPVRPEDHGPANDPAKYWIRPKIGCRHPQWGAWLDYIGAWRQGDKGDEAGFGWLEPSCELMLLLHGPQAFDQAHPEATGLGEA
jgi:hypothetical protein